MRNGLLFRILIAISLLFSLNFITSCSNTFSVEIQPSSGGSVTPSSGSYDKGVAVQVTATPNAGYRFDHWEGAASGKSPVVQLTMGGSKKVIAFFTKTYALNVSASPSGGGTVSPSRGTYDEGQSVTIVASPSTNYQFTGWAVIFQALQVALQ